MGHVLPPAINLHFWKPCNYRCKFCFATFDDDDALKAVRSGLGRDDCTRLIRLLREAGADKINFVGGEPTLAPFMGDLLVTAREVGLVTSLVTNGERLAALIDSHGEFIDWVGLSVDSASELVGKALGRGRGGHVARSLQLFDLMRSRGIRAKLNTTVTRLSFAEDMSSFVLQARPERWKVFQVLPVEGQNDGGVDDLLITPEQFEEFVQRHRHLRDRGIDLAIETNEDMTGSYAMIDPLGRFFSNAGGRHVYSSPILAAGVNEAFAQVQFSHERFLGRGGQYDWRPLVVTLSAKAGLSKAGGEG